MIDLQIFARKQLEGLPAFDTKYVRRSANYISAPAVEMDKPSTELKAFAKTKTLSPGESQVLEFTLTPADLASFNTAKSSWIADAGNYLVRIGDAQETYVFGSFKLPKE